VRMVGTVERQSILSVCMGSSSRSRPRAVRQSGMGLPHSTTLARRIACHAYGEVMECGSPMPILLRCWM
jgi:hypothetical protein